jgi:TonB family protein
MKSSVHEPLAGQREPRFLLELGTPETAGQWIRAGGGSIAVHVALILILIWVAGLQPPNPAELAEVSQKRVTPLVAPPFQLTQKAPNKGPLSKEFNLESIRPETSARNVQSSPGAASLPAQPRHKFVAPVQPKAPVPTPQIADAPSIETGQSRLPQQAPPALGMQIAPPQIVPEEKPKIAFEKPGLPSGVPQGSGISKLPAPKPGIQEAIRQSRSARGMVIGDTDDSFGGQVPTSKSSPMPGRLGSSIELLSDPAGVDFWPYLIKVLATVRRNWYAVIPESARLGRVGRVVIQFAIGRDGTIVKLVIADSSGADPLDRAAVAAFSASNPFPPLPTEFKGTQIRLQFAFDYKLTPR